MKKSAAQVYSLGQKRQEQVQARSDLSYMNYLASLDFQQLILESYELLNQIKIGPLTNELVSQCHNLVGHLSTRLSFSSNDMDQSFANLKKDLNQKISDFKGLLQTF